MNAQDVKVIRDKLEIILVTQGAQKEAAKGMEKHLGNIDKHLEAQNNVISKNKEKVAIHGVWINIVSVVVLAVITAVVVSFFKQ